MLNGKAELSVRQGGETVLEFAYAGNEALCARITQELADGPFPLGLSIKDGGVLQGIVECIYFEAGGRVKVGTAPDSVEEHPHYSMN